MKERAKWFALFLAQVTVGHIPAAGTSAEGPCMISAAQHSGLLAQPAEVTGHADGT